MIDKLNDKPAATIGLLVDAISVGRSLDKREKGKERRSSEAERRKSPRQGCLEDTRGQETGRRNAIRRYANEIHSEALRRVCIPPFWTLCLRDLTRDDRESGGRGKRGGGGEELKKLKRERERRGGERNEEKTPRRRDAPLDANSKPAGWRPLGPRGLLKPMRAAIFSFKRRA